MTKKQKKNLIRIIVSFIMLVVLHFIPVTGPVRFCLYMIPYLVVGYDILKKAVKGVINRQPFDECFLMVVATIGAIILALYKEAHGEAGDYVEAVAVMLFYQVGEWFQSYAVGRSRKNIAALMDIRPDYANIEQDGKLVKVDPDEVAIGSVIVVNPGEKVPIDGIVLEGESSLDTSALTGESVPRTVRAGDEIISGSISLNGVLKITTSKEFGESTVSKILDLVSNASSRKSRSEDFITKFARVYTPAVVFSAIALALIPPIVRLVMGIAPFWGTWAYRALTFLVISCPCALVVSIPLSFFAGLGGASRAGVLVKGSNYLEALAKVRTVMFDKTGTLTQGVFEVAGIHHATINEDELLKYAAFAESASSHPIAHSLIKAYGLEIDRSKVSDIKEISGRGVRAVVFGKNVAAGNDKLMADIGIDAISCHGVGTVVHVAIDGKYAGHILIADVVKVHSAEAIKSLHRVGIKRTVMLTGDSKRVGEAVAGELGISEAYTELLPADKVAKVESEIAKKNGNVAFVGDGINDAPVLSRADVGIAMGAMGSDAAIEAADVVLMDDDPLKIAGAIRIARKSMGIVYENIYFAIGIKLLCLVISAVGIGNMWLAIFADTGVLIICVINAIRALFINKRQN